MPFFSALNPHLRLNMGEKDSNHDLLLAVAAA
jgi:hypothetical protein